MVLIHISRIEIPKPNTLTFGGEFIMKKYICEPCGYEYDPELGDPDNGIPPGTPFESLPGNWLCPICFVGKDMFSEEE